MSCRDCNKEESAEDDLCQIPVRYRSSLCAAQVRYRTSLQIVVNERTLEESSECDHRQIPVCYRSTSETDQKLYKNSLYIGTQGHVSNRSENPALPNSTRTSQTPRLHSDHTTDSSLSLSAPHFPEECLPKSAGWLSKSEGTETLTPGQGKYLACTIHAQQHSRQGAFIF